MESTVSTSLRYHDERKDSSSFLSIIQRSFSWHIVTQSLSKTVFKPTVWKRFIDDIFSLLDISNPDIVAFLEQVILHHPTVKFTAKISDTETTFLDTVVYQGTTLRFVLWYIFTSFHPPSVKKDFSKEKSWVYEQTPLKGRLRKYFRFQKALDRQRLASHFGKKNC